MNRYFNIFSNFSDSVVIIDPNTNEKVYFNTSAHTKLGYTHDEFEVIPITDIIDQSIHDSVSKSHQSVIDGKELNIVVKHVRKDGSYQYADLNLVPLQTGDKKYVCTIWKDITPQVEEKNKRIKKNQQLNAFLEVLDELTKSKAFKDGDTKTYFWNVVEIISQTLDIDRVSIRLYSSDKKELISYAMYDKIKKREINGKTLTLKEHPEFFEFIENEALIKIDDIYSNEELKSMIEVFFSKDGMIHSLLGSKIYIGNNVSGYIFFQSRKKITWDNDDILFANQISNNISIMLINARLIDQNEKLEGIVGKRTRELKEQIEIAEKANLAKSQFLSNISHEIRTPLNAILGFTSLIDKQKLTPELHTYFERIEHGAYQLYDIVNDVLDMSKIESGKMTIHPKWTDLKNLVLETVETFEAQFKLKQIYMDTQFNLEHQHFYLDEIRMKQVLNNLISNALKFTDHGQVNLIFNEDILDSKNAVLNFSIKDTGIGIRKEDQNKLFTPFEQIDQSGTKRYEGTGLGLAITRSILETMNGTISFETEWGKGSTFFVRMTAEFMTKNSIPAEPLIDDNLNESLKYTNILIVDDNPINIEFIYDTFEKKAKYIEKALSGYDALKKVEEKYYDLIIMDIHMPLISGFQTSRLIKMIPQYHESKIIALSADALDKRLKESESYGIDKYLIKPISSKNLIQECEKIYLTNKKHSFYNFDDHNLNDIFVKDIGFDFELAMTYLGNKPSLFLKLLKQFENNHKLDLIMLKKHIDNNQMLEAKLVVHNLKGVLKTLGMNQLAIQVTDFEEKLFTPSSKDYLDNDFCFLRSRYDDMLYIINYILKYF